MKILWLNHRCLKNPLSGGAETTIFQVGRRLVSRGHEIHLLTGGWEGARREEIISGIIIRRFGKRVMPHLALPAFLNEHQDADLIIDDLAHAMPWFSPWLSRLPGLVFFRHLHSRTLNGQVSSTLALGLSHIERQYSLIYKRWPFVTESESSRQDLISLGISHQRINLIPPGVDLATFKPSKKEQIPLIVHLGRLMPYKRTDHALLALNNLLKRGVRANLIIIGDGPMLRQLRSIVDEMNIQAHVTFTGKIASSQVADILSRAWVNIHCSVSEGWGYSTMEAASSGTPTVAYRVPGISSSVQNGKTGVLVEDGNIRELSFALEQVLEAPQTWISNCRSYAEKFSWDAATDKWEKLIANCTL